MGMARWCCTLRGCKGIAARNGSSRARRSMGGSNGEMRCTPARTDDAASGEVPGDLMRQLCARILDGLGMAEVDRESLG